MRAETGVTVDRSTWQGQLKAFLPIPLVPAVSVIVLIIIGALIGLLATGTSFTALPATIAQSWLVANASPVASVKVSLGTVPTLIAVCYAWSVARRVRIVIKERVTLRDLVALSSLVLAIPVILTAIALGMLADAAKVYPVAVPSVAGALGQTFLLHLVAMMLGMGSMLWTSMLRHFNVPTWPVASALTAIRWLVLVWLGSGLVTLLSLLVHFRTVLALHEAIPGAAAAAGLWVVTAGYLPNIVLAGQGFVMGSDLVVSDGHYSVFGVAGVPLPPLPFFAALPAGQSSWMMVLLAIPAAAATFLALSRMVRSSTPIRESLGAGIFAGLFTAAALVLNFGQAGAYGYVGPDLLLTPVLAAAWLGVIGALVSLVHRFFGEKIPFISARKPPADPLITSKNSETTTQKAAPAAPAEAATATVTSTDDAPTESPEASAPASDSAADTSTASVADTVLDSDADSHATAEAATDTELTQVNADLDNGEPFTVDANQDEPGSDESVEAELEQADSEQTQEELPSSDGSLVADPALETAAEPAEETTADETIEVEATVVEAAVVEAAAEETEVEPAMEPAPEPEK